MAVAVKVTNEQIARELDEFNATADKDDRDAERRARGIEQPAIPGVVTNGEIPTIPTGRRRGRRANGEAATGPEGEQPEESTPPDDGAPPVGQREDEPTDYERNLPDVLAKLARLVADAPNGGELPPDLRDSGYPAPSGLDFARGGFVQDFIPPASQGSAADLAAIAEYWIERERERFAHLAFCEIRWLWAAQGTTVQGKLAAAKIRLARKHLRHFSGVTYIAEVAADLAENATWGDIFDTVRHEMLHTGTKEGKYVVLPHEFEGFLAELDGERLPAHVKMVARQLGLPLR